MSLAAVRPVPASRRGFYVSDRGDAILSWLDSIVEDQRRRHPGRRITISGVVVEALELVRRNPDLEEKLRR